MHTSLSVQMTSPNPADTNGYSPANGRSERLFPQTVSLLVHVLLDANWLDDRGFLLHTWVGDCFSFRYGFIPFLAKNKVAIVFKHTDKERKMSDKMPLRVRRSVSTGLYIREESGGHGCWNGEMIVKSILSDKGEKEEEEQKSQTDGCWRAGQFTVKSLKLPLVI